MAEAPPPHHRDSVESVCRTGRQIEIKAAEIKEMQADPRDEEEHKLDRSAALTRCGVTAEEKKGGRRQRDRGMKGCEGTVRWRAEVPQHQPNEGTMVNCGKL